MRFSGQEVNWDVANVPRGLATRFAGKLPLEHPELVDHICSSILPTSEQTYDNQAPE